MVHLDFVFVCIFHVSFVVEVCFELTIKVFISYTKNSKSHGEKKIQNDKEENEHLEVNNNILKHCYNFTQALKDLQVDERVRNLDQQNDDHE